MREVTHDRYETTPYIMLEQRVRQLELRVAMLSATVRALAAEQQPPGGVEDAKHRSGEVGV